jgi:hypothetical protein
MDYGCIGLIVDARPGAVEFYSRYGFIAVEPMEGQSDARPQPVLMFLSLSAIKTAASK